MPSLDELLLTKRSKAFPVLSQSTLQSTGKQQIPESSYQVSPRIEVTPGWLNKANSEPARKVHFNLQEQSAKSLLNSETKKPMCQMAKPSKLPTLEISPIGKVLVFILCILLATRYFGHREDTHDWEPDNNKPTQVEHTANTSKLYFDLSQSILREYVQLTKMLQTVEYRELEAQVSANFGDHTSVVLLQTINSRLTDHPILERKGQWIVLRDQWWNHV